MDKNLKSKVKYFEHNTIGQDYIVGDLHGCLEDLNILLEYISFDKSVDRLFSVGDLVDRGPNSIGCLRLLREPWFHSVIGNHEQMMVDALHKKDFHLLNHWIINGGAWHSQLEVEEQFEVHDLIAVVKKLPLVIVIGKDSDNRINIVHAEMNRDKSYDDATDEDIDDWFFDDINENNMVWGRQIVQLKSLFANKPRAGLSLTVVGHTPVDFPVNILSHMYIDTAAVYWHKQQYEKAKLTLLRVSDKAIFTLDMKSGAVSEN